MTGRSPIIRKGVAKAEEDLGPIEILINNACVTRGDVLHKMTPEHWRTVIEIDLAGCFNTCRAVGLNERRRTLADTPYDPVVIGLEGG